MLFHEMGMLLMGLALCGAVYTLTTAVLVVRYRRPSPSRELSRSVTILKPLHFTEPGLKDAIASFLRQSYAGPVQLVLGVQDHADPAIAIVRALQSEFRQADVSLVIDTQMHGSNRKVSNLINMARLARHEVVIVSDSDISVQTDWLSRVVACLEQDGVGAVSCLYAGAPRGNFWSVIAAMGSTYEFLPNVVAGMAFGLASPCFGSTIALKRTVLDKIGGFRAFADQLADDYEMGRAVRALGLRLVLPAFAVEHTSPETRWTEFYRHEVRWNRTTHAIDPIGHTFSVVTHAFPLALLGMALAGIGFFTLCALAATLVSRLVLKWCIERTFATAAGPAWALPVRDVLSFVVFLASFFGDNVHWRGNQFAVSPSGALTSHEAL